MIEGIYYYPWQKKNNTKFKLWILLLVLILIIVYWSFDNKIKSETSKSKRIIISGPKIETVVKNPPPQPTQSRQKPPEILENLDELVEIYQKTQ